MERTPLTCGNCHVAYLIERVQTGWAAIRPGHWWQPNTEHWAARCACDVIQARGEGELYRAMGLPYA